MINNSLGFSPWMSPARFYGAFAKYLGSSQRFLPFGSQELPNSSLIHGKVLQLNPIPISARAVPAPAKPGNCWKGNFDPRCPVGAGTEQCPGASPSLGFGIRSSLGITTAQVFSHCKSEGGTLVRRGNLRNVSCSPSQKTSGVKWDQQPVFHVQGRREGLQTFPNALLIPWFLLEAKGARMRQLCLAGAGCHWSFPWKPINTTWRGRGKLPLILKYCWKGGNGHVPFGRCRNKQIFYQKNGIFCIVSYPS